MCLTPKQLWLVSTEKQCKQCKEAKGTGFVYVHSNLVMNYHFSDLGPDSPSLAQQDCCGTNTALPVSLLRNSSADHKLRFAGHLLERSYVSKIGWC